MGRKIPLDSRCEYPAARLGLEILVSADMIRVGMGIINGIQNPAVPIQNLLNLLSRIPVIAAVDEISPAVLGNRKPHLCGTLDIIGMVRYLNQLIHFPFLPLSLSVISAPVIIIQNEEKDKTLIPRFFHKYLRYH